VKNKMAVEGRVVKFYSNPPRVCYSYFRGNCSDNYVYVLDKSNIKLFTKQSKERYADWVSEDSDIMVVSLEEFEEKTTDHHERDIILDTCLNNDPKEAVDRAFKSWTKRNNRLKDVLGGFVNDLKDQTESVMGENQHIMLIQSMEETEEKSLAKILYPTSEVGLYLIVYIDLTTGDMVPESFHDFQYLSNTHKKYEAEMVAKERSEILSKMKKYRQWKETEPTEEEIEKFSRADREREDREEQDCLDRLAEEEAQQHGSTNTIYG